MIVAVILSSLCLLLLTIRILHREKLVRFISVLFPFCVRKFTQNFVTNKNPKCDNLLFAVHCPCIKQAHAPKLNSKLSVDTNRYWTVHLLRRIISISLVWFNLFGMNLKYRQGALIQALSLTCWEWVWQRHQRIICRIHHTYAAQLNCIFFS